MEIVIAAGGMPFGPTTINQTSLGGSEIAATLLGRELRNRGHIVTMFTDLPAPPRPDAFEGGMDDWKVRWLPAHMYQDYVQSTEFDLLIASRDPRFLAVPAQAGKKVLWCHDIATHRGMQVALDQMSWAMDEIWTVSKWHKKQIHTVTGYPLSNIRPLRNGIVPFTDEELGPLMRSQNTLFYAARPERGLENLIKPDGVMTHLKDFELEVAMYEHFPEHMQEYYQMLWDLMYRNPNVKHLGGLTALETRRHMAQATAYIYPTQFEETSCLLAREAISTGTPFITTKEGALPETLGDCGLFFEDSGFYNKNVEKGSAEWCERFAKFARDVLSNKSALLDVKRDRMARRTDLYWDGVAKMAEKGAKPRDVKPFSRARSLIMDGDVVPAKAYIESLPKWDKATEKLYNEIRHLYPFILDEDDPDYKTLAEYYAGYYSYKKPELKFSTQITGARHQQFDDWIKEEEKKRGKLYVVEYGSGEGHVLGWLANKYPQHEFMGFDQVQSNVDLCNEGVKKEGLTNIRFEVAETPLEAGAHIDQCNVVICTEVLEHCVCPWEVLTQIQDMVDEGATIMLTTPTGPWEWASIIRGHEDYEWRNHIWHLNKSAMREMLREKPDAYMTALSSTNRAPDMRALGHICFKYTNDREPIPALDPVKRAMAHSPRQSCAAAVIAMNNEDTILKMLNSIEGQVSHVQIALGPSSDHTEQYIKEWFDERDTMSYEIVRAPKIRPAYFNSETKEWEGGFGFDDARKLSVEGLEDQYDWILWIDTDEHVSGDFTKYLRHNDFDAYLIPQHHHTVQPRGHPPQIDRPARLFRSGRGFTPRGKVHEHFEKMPKGGPGRTYMLQDVDLAHIGYTNEEVRQSRFHRNFPLLEWDQHVNPDRPLGKYLWFRDIVHRMRYALNDNNPKRAMELAQEGEQFFQDNFKMLCRHGGGSFMVVDYLTELRSVLRTGVEMKCQIQLENQSVTLSGRFKDEKELTKIIALLTKPEVERRQSRYY